jgi:polysaccharide export outer membrane protein
MNVLASCKIGFRLPSLRTLGLLLALVPAASYASEPEYVLRPGDKIELKVLSLPELGQISAIDISGRASLPLIGFVKIDGMTVSDLQSMLRSTLPNKIFYKRNSEGKKIAYVAEAEEIVVNIVEYRPIFVSGDVPKPGEQPFRPGMRVHQALAVAGGNDLMGLRLGSGLLNIFDYHGNREALLLEYAQEQARNWRIAGELDGTPSTGADELSKRLISKSGSNAAALVRIEADQLNLRSADWQRQLDYLKNSINQANSRVQVLTKLYRNESEGSVADEQEFERMRGLLDKSLTSQNRVTESRRAMLISATSAASIS